jgi:hypothetical protein
LGPLMHLFCLVAHQIGIEPSSWRS